MLRVVAFMKQVADGLQMEGNFGTAHVYRSSLNAIIAYHGKGDFTFNEVTPEWIKGFEIHLRGRGCSWNTVSTYLRTFRAVYNRAVDCRGAVYVPHLFRSVYTGTRADRKRALDTEDIQKVFTKLPQSPAVTSDIRRAQELFVLMFLLRGLPFVDLAYLRKSDLRDNVITYRRRKTGRPLSVTLTSEAMAILKRYMDRDSSSPYLFPLLNSREGTKEAYHEYQLALRNFNRQLMLLGEMLGLGDKLSSYTARHTWATTAYYCEIHPGVISEAMGHSSITVTETYLKPFQNKKIDEANKKVVDFIKRSMSVAIC
ncbi:site-specific integrase [Bacteroides faecis]|uniref:tyrosine-type recombinase/integrase n=2 Tax=Bacteroides faecis TaxID=674529 RepID=UPI001C3FC211|nr:site-specific integrase [Bacteroides faecis]MCS2577596.1 site-specific integrase [Bacteroides faecis]MCS3326706.1 site-specific integrase [Bacteroides faecis]